MGTLETAVVVLAAGQGTRMKSATPKVLHPLAGIPLIGHVLGTAQALEPEHLVVVLRHERALIEPVVQDLAPHAVVVEQDEIPGTGRAVDAALAALPQGFSGVVVVTSGDVPLLDSDTLRAVIAHHQTHQAQATLLTARYADPTGYGRVVRFEDGRVKKVVEEKDATDEERTLREINAGCYVFDASAVRSALAEVKADNAQGEKYLTDVVAVMVAAGQRVEAVMVEDEWLVEGINDRIQLSEVAARLNRMIIRGWQRDGVTVIDPGSTWIDLRVELAPDVTILPGVQLRGDTVVGSGSTIGPDSTLTDCVIGQNVSVSRTDATDAEVRNGATVGPFAYLRPGTLIDEQGKVGTFVETKNSTIGPGAKVPHLSYIGDAEIGEGTNIGAGTITANYDGVNKSRTTIGRHVRTGSHNVFVAPVTIQDGSYTAAGTVIRRDVPAGSLAVTASQVRHLTDWVLTHRAGTATATAAEDFRSAHPAAAPDTPKDDS